MILRRLRRRLPRWLPGYLSPSPGHYLDLPIKIQIDGLREFAASMAAAEASVATWVSRYNAMRQRRDRAVRRGRWQPRLRVRRRAHGAPEMATR